MKTLKEALCFALFTAVMLFGMSIESIIEMILK